MATHMRLQIPLWRLILVGHLGDRVGGLCQIFALSGRQSKRLHLGERTPPKTEHTMSSQCERELRTSPAATLGAEPAQVTACKSSQCVKCGKAKRGI